LRVGSFFGLFQPKTAISVKKILFFKKLVLNNWFFKRVFTHIKQNTMIEMKKQMWPVSTKKKIFFCNAKNYSV